MTPLTNGLTAALASYLLGSLPFGLLIARMARGIDIREHGSRNIGATNVARVLGMKWGVAVLALDALKGGLPTALLPMLLSSPADPNWSHLRVVCGVAALLGHMYPCWLKFHGGKGVATAAGVVVVLAPLASAGAVGTFLLVFALTRIVSLGSILGVTAFAIIQMVLLAPKPFGPRTWSLAAFSLGAPLLIIYQHRTNIARLLRGEEPRFRAGKSQPPPENPPPSEPAG